MNSSTNSNYYGNIQLLNDLHNYFPEILYGTRFQNDGLVRYIREVVSVLTYFPVLRTLITRIINKFIVLLPLHHLLILCIWMNNMYLQQI